MLSALRAYVLADSSVQAMVEGRMHLGIVPQASLVPMLVYHVISETRQPTMDGADTLPATRVQIDAWAMTPDEALALADAVRHRLDGARGAMSGVTVRGVFADTAGTFFDAETKLHSFRRDYIVWALEPGESP